MTTDESVWEGAWWSAVAEPADPAARVVRSVLGDRAGREWLQAPWSGVPAALGSSTTADWPKQWNRWRERALEADPHTRAPARPSPRSRQTPRLRFILHAEAFSPSIRRRPSAGGRSPAKVLSSKVFPEPLAPMTARVSPS